MICSLLTADLSLGGSSKLCDINRNRALSSSNLISMCFVPRSPVSCEQAWFNGSTRRRCANCKIDPLHVAGRTQSFAMRAVGDREFDFLRSSRTEKRTCPVSV